LTSGPATGLHLSAGVIAIRVGLALLFGMAVGIIYRSSHGREEGSSTTLFTTLVLLSALIAMVSIVIADSVARAFSLVGALSIVRFRTVVDDTRDTAFVIFAVIVGMAVGAGQVVVPLVAIPTIGITAILLSRLASRRSGRVHPRRELVVRMSLSSDPDQALGDVFSVYATRSELKSMATARQGAAFDLTYEVLLRPETRMTAFVADLNRVEGVMNIEMREA
jgi:hypothetical protein